MVYTFLIDMDFVKNNWNITWNTTDSGITLSCDGNNTISSASDMNDLNTPPGDDLCQKVPSK